MANEEVKFRIKLNIDGKEKLVEAKTSVKALADEIEQARTKSTKLRDSLLEINQLSQSFQNALSGLQQLTGVMQQYTQAAAQQEEAETKLATNMRNTMGAREEDVRSILRLVSAQQQLGVIGDEIQLNGAQELATYLTKKSTLEKLIPVMNDMIAQQYGLNATSESAANIATMLGKVMDGQVGALSRYGYKFDEAQEQVLKFGTEEQRAAVLAEVVESAVGGMNESLGKTDAGKAKQSANDIGDMKEAVGALLARIEPTIVAVNEFGTSINGLANIGMGMQGIVVFAKSLKSFNSTLRMANINSRIATGAVNMFSRAIGLQTISVTAGTTAVRALTLALRGLEIATVVGAAFVAMQLIFEGFSSSSEKAKNSVDSLSESEERARQRTEAVTRARTGAISQIESHRAKLQELMERQKAGNDITKEESELVGELNGIYGQTMGYFSSVSQWYKALTKNSEAYCQQLVIEAELRQLANEYATLSSQKYDLWHDEDGKMKKGLTRTKKVDASWVDYDGRLHNATKTVEGSFEKTQKESRTLDDQMKGIKARMGELSSSANKIKMPVVGSATVPSAGGKGKGSANTRDNEKKLELIEDARTYEDLTNNVAWYEEQLKKTDKTETAEIARLQKLRDTAKEAADSIMNVSNAKESVNYDDSTIEGIENKIQLYSDEQQSADAGRIWELQKQIDELTEKRRILTIGMNITGFEEHLNGIRTGETGIDELKTKVEELQELLSNTDIPFGAALGTKLRQLISRYKMLIKVSEEHGRAEEAKQEKLEQLEGLQAAASSVEQLAQSFVTLGEDSKMFASSMVGVSLAASLSQLIAGMVKKANETTLTIWDWIAGVGAGTAAVVSASTQLKGIGVFAKGAIVSGPTLALVGEYSGAQQNPEVIAPLNKLRGMLKEDAGGMNGEVVFRLKYDQLEGVLQRGRRKKMRS